jgi:hypothetical protein
MKQGEQRGMTILPMTTGAVSIPVTISKDGRIHYDEGALKMDERFLRHQLALIQGALGKIEESRRSGNPLDAILAYHQQEQGSAKEVISEEQRRQSVPQTSLEMAMAAFRLLQLRDGGASFWRMEDEPEDEGSADIPRKEPFSIIETEALRSEIANKVFHNCVCKFCGLKGGDMMMMKKRPRLLDDDVLSRSGNKRLEEEEKVEKRRPMLKRKQPWKISDFKNKNKKAKESIRNKYASIYKTLNNESTETSSSSFEGAGNSDE